VSACIAVYNGSEHLAKALQSILGQTVKPDVILVLDDGSTDDSAEIARGFEGVRILQQTNAGIGAARRALIEAATSEWVAFCDHDDWWEPNRLESELLFADDPGVTLIYSGVWHVFENGVQTEAVLHAKPNSPSIDHVVPHPEDIWTSSTLLRRKAVLDAGNFNPRYRTGEDMLMWFQLGGLGKIVQVPQRLVHMQRREASASAPDKSQFEYSVSLYENEVLPNLDRWYSALDPVKRGRYRRILEAKVGYTMSVLAAYCDREGDHASAVRLYRRAAKLAPRSKGVWYRYLRSVLRVPAQPPM
ncbi:MAG: glycosyltransferase family 2 protein, partial [Fimbriimonadales bacterium]